MGNKVIETVDKNVAGTENTAYGANTRGSEQGTTRVDAPSWLLDPAQKMVGQFGGLLNGDVSRYNPGISTLQTDAAMNAGRLGNNNNAYLKAAETLRGVSGGNVRDVTGQSVLTNLDQYQSPYQQQVVDSTLNNFDVNAAKQQAQLAASGARGKFAGSRFGIAEGELGAGQGRERANLQAGLLDTGFTRGADLSAGDAARRQQAMMGNQQTDLGRQQLELSKAGLQTGLNASMNADAVNAVRTQADVGQGYTDAENTQRMGDITTQGALGGVFAGYNPSSYFGQSTAGRSRSGTTGYQDTASTETTHQKTVGKKKLGLLGKIGKGIQVAQKGAELAAMFA